MTSISWKPLIVAAAPLAVYLGQNYLIAPLNGHGFIGTLAAGGLIYLANGAWDWVSKR